MGNPHPKRATIALLCMILSSLLKSVLLRDRSIAPIEASLGLGYTPLYAPDLYNLFV